jgi:FtsP/CotA-like multicopper oxidase with cupredoxin domain/peroxiredoxin
MVVTRMPPAIEMKKVRCHTLLCNESTQAGQTYWIPLNSRRQTMAYSSPKLKAKAIWAVFLVCAISANATVAQSLTSPNEGTSVSRLSNVRTDQSPFVGKWTYRSFVSNPDLNAPVNTLLFGLGTMELSVPAPDHLSGTLGGEGWQLMLTGSVTGGNPSAIRFQGKGTVGREEWVYDYLGFLVPPWPNGVDQRPAIVGTIVRTVPHSGGAAKAGYVAQWIAVKQDVTNAPGLAQPSRSPAGPSQAGVTKKVSPYNRLLGEMYLREEKEQKKNSTREHGGLPKKTSLNAPSSLQPTTIRSANGRLDVTLELKYETVRIGRDDVRLRTYNGKLVGPVLRVKAGDTLYVTLINRLPTESTPPHSINGHHEWNTTNLHYHGLHVAPQGPQGQPDAESDNVLLELKPTTDPGGAIQKYQVHVPANHVAGTFWYHAHKHGGVAAQVSSGMAGPLIIERDDTTHNLDSVPEIAAAAEEVLLLQQVPYLRPDPSQPGSIERSPETDPQPNQAVMFGPGQWPRLRRYVTVNGQRIPTITVSPGEVKRLRFIDSGQRESMNLRIERAPQSTGTGPDLLKLYEIAVDGLPTGTIREISETQTLELFPGYRSDVLIQPPTDASGEYYLVDTRWDLDGQPWQETGADGSPELLRWIAKIVVTGPPKAMNLPGEAALSSHRLADILPSTVTGAQYAFYGIYNAADPQFFVSRSDLSQVLNSVSPQDAKSYDPNDPRVLLLGKTEKWLVGSRNDNLNVTHPFHIHTNPFLITKIASLVEPGNIGVPIDVTQREIGSPTWRDTLGMKQGYTYELLTRYEDYTGSFVDHCHILDHEDNGMMELVRLDRSPMAAMSIGRNLTSRRISTIIPESNGIPSVLLFVKGSICPHCMAQLTEMGNVLSKRNLSVTVVSASGEEEFENFPTAPFTLVSDPGHKLFRKYAVSQGGTRHATIVLDGTGRVAWKRVGDTPFMDADAVLAAAVAAGPTIELEVRNTPSLDDDYVTWSPTPCRIRQVNGSAPVVVTLTNDPPGAIPQGGDVAFAASLQPGTTATADTVTLTLPASGDWAPFFIAGRKASTATAATLGKDAVIEVHEGNTTGPILKTHAVMVRVRKEVSQLTDFERSEFLKAFHDLHVNRQGFERFVLMHRLATGRRIGPDQAHKGSAFITWHRAFLLLFERELQKTYPHVTLPYWIQGPVTTIYSPEFLGQNDASTNDITFDSLNPLYGWAISLPQDPPGSIPQPMGPLQRSNRDHNSTTSAFRQWSAFQARDAFADFIPELFNGDFKSGNLEPNPHDFGHGFVGPPGRWMSNCRESDADPAFWVFHCYHDYLWAKWQWYNDRFRADGMDPNHYAPADHYQAGNSDALGHHLFDTMWPWDLTTGYQIPGDYGSLRPPENTFGRFPKAPYPNQWPADDASPTPGDTIDYQGQKAGSLELGFCYDDLPFGAKTQSLFAQAERASVRSREDSMGRFALSTFLDGKASVEVRVQAVDHIHGPALAKKSQDLLQVLRAPESPVTIRQRALRLLFESNPVDGTNAALEILQDNQSPPALAAHAAEQLQRAMHFSPITAKQHEQIHTGFVVALRSRAQPEVAAVVIRTLAAIGAAEVQPVLGRFLSDPVGSPLPLPEVIGLLKDYPDQWPAVRKLLDRPNPQVVTAALKALARDKESEEARKNIVADTNAAVGLRTAAISSLTLNAASAAELFLTVFKDPTAPRELREEAGAAFRVNVRAQGQQISGERKNQLLKSLQDLHAMFATDSRLEKLRDMAIEAVRRSQGK